MKAPQAQLSTRSPIERLAWIGGRLRDNEWFNCSAVVRRFEVSRKTAVRDIEFMRDRLGWPIEFDRSNRRYHLGSAPPEATI